MKIVRGAVLAMCLLALVGAVGHYNAHADEIRIATQPIPHYSPIFVAKQKKWVEEELRKTGSKDVVVKWASFAAGPPINESFAAGQQDFGLLGDTPAIIAKSAGINTRVVSLTSYGPKSLAVIVPTHSSIKAPKDLRGKKVAVVKGSYAHHLLVLVLQKGGLSTGDIQLINLSQADIVTAIANGNIDAAAVWEPLITRLETQGIARVLADGTGIKKGVLVLVASNDFLLKHRDWAKAVLRAYKRGADFIRSNPGDASQLIASEVNLPPDLLLKVFGKFSFDPTIRADDIEELKRSESFMRSAGLIKSPVNINDFVDIAIGREAGFK